MSGHSDRTDCDQISLTTVLRSGWPASPRTPPPMSTITPLSTPASIPRSRLISVIRYETTGLVHYCHLAANLVLAWPNDGVAETDYCDLPGAHHESHVKERTLSPWINIACVQSSSCMIATSLRVDSSHRAAGRVPLRGHALAAAVLERDARRADQQPGRPRHHRLTADRHLYSFASMIAGNGRPHQINCLYYSLILLHVSSRQQNKT